MYYRLIISFILLITINACSHVDTTKSNEQVTTINNNATPQSIMSKYDYPTRDRVQYVLDCIAQHASSAVKFGSVNYVTQYACGCKIDKMAEKLTFEEFEAAISGSYLSKLPGESGSAFRNSNPAKELKKRFKEIDEDAEKSCFVK